MRVAKFPVSPPGGAVPSVPLSVHTDGYFGSGSCCGLRNGTSERLVLSADDGSRPLAAAPVEVNAVSIAAVRVLETRLTSGLSPALATPCLIALRWPSANGIAQTAISKSR